VTVDERLGRLVERHEALAQTVELLVAEGREVDKRLSRCFWCPQSNEGPYVKH
jgi:hypothetical protein